MATELLLFGSVTAGVAYLLHRYMSRNKRPPSARLVGRVKAINLYPCKSMAGISLEECQCASEGLIVHGVRDR